MSREAIILLNKVGNRSRVAIVVGALFLFVSVLTCLTRASLAQPIDLRVWNFDADSVGRIPQDFAVGTLFDGRPAGEWQVVEVGNAPSAPHVLAQQMNKGAEHAYKVVFVESTEASDVDLEVTFLAVSGKGDMGGGAMWRAQDDRNYYLSRANPLEQNIRAYRVVNGVRKQLANFDHIIAMNKWHRLRVLAHGDHFQVFFDGQSVLEFQDQKFSTGRIGLWTKSDAVTYFDDLKLLTLR